MKKWFSHTKQTIIYIKIIVYIRCKTCSFSKYNNLSFTQHIILYCGFNLFRLIKNWSECIGKKERDSERWEPRQAMGLKNRKGRRWSANEGLGSIFVAFANAQDGTAA